MVPVRLVRLRERTEDFFRFRSLISLSFSHESHPLIICYSPARNTQRRLTDENLTLCRHSLSLIAGDGELRSSLSLHHRHFHLALPSSSPSLSPLSSPSYLLEISAFNNLPPISLRSTSLLPSTQTNSSILHTNRRRTTRQRSSSSSSSVSSIATRSKTCPSDSLRLRRSYPPICCFCTRRSHTTRLAITIDLPLYNRWSRP